MNLRRISALFWGMLAMTVGLSIVFAAGWTPPPSGSWQCFDANEFPATGGDPARWTAWDASQATRGDRPKAFAVGLNRIARNSPAGTTLSVPLDSPMGGHYNLICVK